MAERLQKILSAAGIASRRTAETLIQQGRVSVNGQTVTELGTKADADADEIRVDGRRIKGAQRRRYLLLYKPRGYITTRSDPQHRPTVIDLLVKGGVREYVYPVGRLDYDSEGLLLLTSDGDLAARLTHPRHGIEREYEVRVRGVPDEHELERLSRGVSLEGRRTSPARVGLKRVIEGESGQQSLLSFVIHEGRNRQVRSMCDAIGHPVVRLRRVRIGPITDDHIRPGEFRDLTAGELAQLNRAARSGAGPPRATAKGGPADEVPLTERRQALRGVAAPAGAERGMGPPRATAKGGPGDEVPRTERRQALRGVAAPAGAERGMGPPRATAKGGPGDEVPRTKEARPRTGSGARSRPRRGTGRPGRG